MMRKGHGKGILRSLAFTDVYFSLQTGGGFSNIVDCCPLNKNYMCEFDCGDGCGFGVGRVG